MQKENTKESIFQFLRTGTVTPESLAEKLGISIPSSDKLYLAQLNEENQEAIILKEFAEKKVKEESEDKEVWESRADFAQKRSSGRYQYLAERLYDLIKEK